METTFSRVLPGGCHEPVTARPLAGRRPSFLRLTHRGAARIRQAIPFVAGILIGLSAWTPAFVLTAEETDWQQYGLAGGLAMFSAGVWLRIGSTARRTRQAQPRDPAMARRPRMDRLPA